MDKYKIGNIISTIIIIIGVAYQLYSDAYIKDGNDHGTFIFLIGLGLYVLIQFAQSRNKKVKQ